MLKEETGENSAWSELYFCATPVGISMSLPRLVVLHEVSVVQCKIVEIREGNNWRRRNAVRSIYNRENKKTQKMVSFSPSVTSICIPSDIFLSLALVSETYWAGREPWWLMGSTMSTWTWAVAPLVWQGTAVWWWRAVGVPPAAWSASEIAWETARCPGQTLTMWLSGFSELLAVMVILNSLN